MENRIGEGSAEKGVGERQIFGEYLPCSQGEGGMTSHAAINSRRMAKPCVTGCQTLDIDREAEVLRIDSFELGPGDTLSIDGYTGEVFLGAVEVIEPQYPQAVSDHHPLDLEQYINTYNEWKRDFPELA